MHYYQATANASTPFAALQGNHEAHVVVVGGGYAGLNTALGLVERGVHGVVLLEQAHLGYGASGRNGGFVFAGYALDEAVLLAKRGQAQAKRLFLGTIQAIELMRARVARYGIACQTVDEGVIWANWFRRPDVLKQRQDFLRTHFDVHWDMLTQEQIQAHVRSTRYSGGLYERNAFHLHPLNYALGLAQAAHAQGASIHEQSRVCRIQKQKETWCVSTDQGQVRAPYVVLACGGYLAGLDPSVDRAVLPIATYVMATEPLGDKLTRCFNSRAAVYDTRFAFDYYRPLPDTRLLWGGRISILDRSPKAVQQLLYRDVLRVFPQLEGVKIDYAWSGLMSYARHKMPQLGTRGDGLWWAQAFGGHGLSSTTWVGELLARALAEKDQAWRDFSAFGLSSAMRPFGYLAAQASYTWYQARDAWRDWMRY